MSSDRITRVNEILKREIAEGIFRIMTNTDFDLAATTVTHVVASRNLRQARVWVSIRCEEEQARKMLSMLKQRSSELQQRINKNLALKYTPRLSFELDVSLAEGHRVLDLLADIEQTQGFGNDTAPDEPGREADSIQ